MSEWWRDAVVYQVYPRSFQDSDGDGVGDLAGIERRLDHLTWLGADALWLSPIYPSPLADFGYDVGDHTAVDPVFGTLADFDRLLAAAHERGLRVLLDLVAVATPRSSTPGSAITPTGTCGRRASVRRTTGSRRSADRLVPPSRHRPLVPALLLSGAARPRLAQPGGAVGDAGGGPLLDRPRRRRLPRRRGRPPDQGSGAARRAGRDGALRPPASARGCGVGLHPLRERPGDPPRPGGPPRGGRRCPPRRRGLPAERAAGPLPRPLRPRLRLRAPALAAAGRAPRRGDRGGCRARAGRLGPLQPRLPQARDPLGAAAGRAPPRCSC